VPGATYFYPRKHADRSGPPASLAAPRRCRRPRGVPSPSLGARVRRGIEYL